MNKPVIWHLRGKWWCGRYTGILRTPVADILGHGSSPLEAYESWVRCKWGIARALVNRRRTRIVPAKVSSSVQEKKKFSLMKWLRGNENA